MMSLAVSRHQVSPPLLIRALEFVASKFIIQLDLPPFMSYADWTQHPHGKENVGLQRYSLTTLLD